MKISSIQNYGAPNYQGSFVKDSAFKEFERKLIGTDKDTFNTIIKNIENTKDDHHWWFDVSSIRKNRMKIAVIGQLNKDGTPKKPGYFIDEEKNSLELFKKLAEWYKNNVEGYKK